MEMSLLLFVLIGSALHEVDGACTDVDTDACQAFKLNNPKACENKCIADICKSTCGFCPLTCYHCDSVSRPEDCSTTQQCKSTAEICIATQRLAHGLLQPLYSSGCVDKAVCRTLFNYASSAGKRAYTLHGGCCDTDLCNIHDPDGNITSDTTVEMKVAKQVKVDIDDATLSNRVLRAVPADPDTCADFDLDNVACGLLNKASPESCNTDCIGRQICPITCGTCVQCKTCADVNSAALCNNITLCKKTQSCFSKEQLRSDFTLGIDLKCMDDFICHAYFGGILKTRKRQFPGNMRLSGQCCKSNVCNANGIIQPTSPSA